MPKASGSKRYSAAQKSQRKPVVFMFQPTEFVPVTPRKMKDWEQGLRSVLGENATALRNLLRQSGFETTSICRPGGADDCDWHGEIE